MDPKIPKFTIKKNKATKTRAESYSLFVDGVSKHTFNTMAEAEAAEKSIKQSIQDNASPNEDPQSDLFGNIPVADLGSKSSNLSSSSSGSSVPVSEVLKVETNRGKKSKKATISRVSNENEYMGQQETYAQREEEARNSKLASEMADGRDATSSSYEQQSSQYWIAKLKYDEAERKRKETAEKNIEAQMLAQVKEEKKQQDLYFNTLGKDHLTEMKDKEAALKKEETETAQYWNARYASEDKQRAEELADAKFSQMQLRKTVTLFTTELGNTFELTGNAARRLGSVFGDKEGKFSKIASGILVLGTEIEKASLKISEALGTNLTAGAARAGMREFNTFSSIFSSGPLVSSAQQANTGEAFQKQFGGILQTNLEKTFSQVARNINLSGDKFLAGITSFIPIAGSFDKAQQMFQKSVSVFTAQGLTSAEAFKFASDNQELVARYGAKAATELAKAASEAKLAGYSLEKIQGLSDSISTDFGSFLDKANELSALGINLPIAQLGQASLTEGSVGVARVLSEALNKMPQQLTQVQTAMISKDLGIPFNELLNLGKKDSIQASVKEKMDLKAVDAMSSMSKTLEKMLTAFTLIGSVVSGIAALVAANAVISIATSQTAVNTSLLVGEGAVGGKGGLVGLVSKLGSLGVASKVLGGGVLGAAGIVGGTALINNGHPILGTAAGIAGGAANGALWGSAFGPEGTLLGAGIGAVIGGIAPHLLADRKGDDVVSHGYGKRMLMTPTGNISLNNNDTVIAYAKPQSPQLNDNTKLLSKGDITPPASSTPPVNVNVDMSALEKKMEELNTAISKIKFTGNVLLDGRKVGTSLQNTVKLTDTLAVTKVYNYD